MFIIPCKQQHRSLRLDLPFSLIRHRGDIQDTWKGVYACTIKIKITPFFSISTEANASI